MQSLYSFFRISKPSPEKIDPAEVDVEYRRLRRSTFLSATLAYSIFYICRMTLNVAKQPLIDSGVMSAVQLGLTGSAMLFVYAIGRFCNGFIADYCNARRFMSFGLLVSALINLAMALIGLVSGGVHQGSWMIFLAFALLWGVNGWVQSMGSAPGVISLSRWFPLSSRGTMYSLFSATPYIGKFLSFIILGSLVSRMGWQAGFGFSAFAGLLGVLVLLLFMWDTPESKGLPSIQDYSSEKVSEVDKMPTRQIQAMVLRHPGIWVIALSAAFVYIVQYGISGWGILFLQKAKGFELEGASRLIAFSEAFGILGTVGAGWLSDTLFRGDRVRPVVISGLLGTLSLAFFLLGGDSVVMNFVSIAIFSLSIGILYCLVAGLMAIDIVPRKATGASMGLVGLFCYISAGFQDILSGVLIQGGSAEGSYDFSAAVLFWLAAMVLSFVIPSVSWRHLKKQD